MAIFDEYKVIYRYKYLPYSPAALQTIIAGTMKFSCGLDFNDPFDCNPYFDLEHISNIATLRPDLFKAAGDRRGLSPAKRIAEKGQFTARLRNRIKDGTFRRQQLERIGIVSLSREGRNVLMWSHYAELHKGFVLEFRIPVLGEERDMAYATDRLLPFPISYQQGRPNIKIGTDMPNDLVERIVLTKSADWIYEAEERVVDHLRPPGVYPYRRDEILATVIAGMRMEPSNRAELGKIVALAAETGLSGLKVYDAVEVPSDFGILVPSHPRLGVD